MSALPSVRQLRANAPANVVVLPTAAPRQVDNSRYADQRRASCAARRESPFRGVYKHHHDREADALAAELYGIHQTPALLILSAMLRTMDSDAATQVLDQLTGDAAASHRPSRQAVAAIKASRLTTGRQFDLMRALDRLREGC